MAESSSGSQSAGSQSQSLPDTASRPKAKAAGATKPCKIGSPTVIFLGARITKPFSDIWKHFTRTENGKFQCSKCPWQSSPNATRMIAHWKEIHVNNDPSLGEEEPPEKKSKLLDHFDCTMTPGQREKAAKQLVFAMINNGWSYNSVQSPSFQFFCRSLRWIHKANFSIKTSLQE